MSQKGVISRKYEFLNFIEFFGFYIDFSGIFQFF